MELFMMNKVIIRSEEAGVFFGTLEEKNDTQLSQEGTSLPERCQFTVVVPEIIIEKVVEILPCSDVAIKSIEEVPVWKL